jgi:chromosome segregation ATPase
MGIELFLPFLASLSVIWFFRKVDGSGFRVGQLKKYSQKLQDDLDLAAMTGVQAVKDATIDLELTNKQAKKLVTDLQAQAGETTLLLENLKAHKDYLDNVLSELKDVVKVSSEIREESRYVQEGMDIIRSHREELKKMDSENNQIRDQVKELIHGFNEKINTRTTDILESLASKIVELENLLEVKSDKVDETLKDLADNYKQRLSEEVESIITETVERVELANNRIEDFTNFVRDGEKSLEVRLTRYKDTTDSISDRIERLDARLEEKAETVGESVQARLVSFEKKFQEKFESIFDQLSQNKEAFLSGVKMEIDLMRTDVESMSLEIMTRRDEILTEARRQSELVLSSINNFHEKFIDAENRIIKTAELKRGDLQKEIGRFENEFKNTSNAFYSEADSIKESIMKNLHNFESDLSKSLNYTESITREKFNSLREELEESMLSLHGRKKSEFLDELASIDLKIKELTRDTTDKIKNVDDHFYDLKNALMESSKDIIHQVEKEVDRLSSELDGEKNRVDQKIEFLAEGWNSELERIKNRTNKDVDSLTSRLKDIHVEGKDLADEIRSEYNSGKNQLDLMLKKADDNLRNEIDSLTDEVQNKLKKSQDEAEIILARLQKAGINLYEKQESLLGDYGEKLYRDLQSKLEKTRYESEELLEDIQKAGNNLLEKQEEKIDKLKSTIDERISRQLTVLLDKGQLQLDQLEQRIATYVSEVKNNLESNLKNSKDDSERQIANFNSQMQRSFRDMEKVNKEFIDNNREEFQKSREELSKIHITIESEMDKVTRLKGTLLEDFSREESKLKYVMEKISEKMKEIESFSDTIRNTDKVIRESEGTVQTLNVLMDKLREEGHNLQEYSRGLDQLKLAKKDMDTEIRLLETQKIRIEQIENELNRATNVCDLINKRTEELHDKISTITSIDNKLVDMTRMQDELESKISEVKAASSKIYEISQSLQSTNRMGDQISERLLSLERELERVESKEVEISDHIFTIAEKANEIESRSMDLKSVEAKFDKVEHLMMDLSTKHKQVATMQKRIETLKADSEEMREGLEGLLVEADDKFQKLSDFLNNIEGFIETKGTSSQVPQRPTVIQPPPKATTPREREAMIEMSKKKKATVLNLYENYSWSTDTIAEKLNMEKSMVEAIIHGR